VRKSWLSWIHPRGEKGIGGVESGESYIQEYLIPRGMWIVHVIEAKPLNALIGVHQPCAHQLVLAKLASSDDGGLVLVMETRRGVFSMHPIVFKSSLDDSL
jgi:hypothetical protein